MRQAYAVRQPHSTSLEGLLPGKPYSEMSILGRRVHTAAESPTHRERRCLIHLDNICGRQIGNHGHGHMVTFKDRCVLDTDMHIEAQFS